MTVQADVVVPVFAGAELTERCLTSVLEHSGPELRRLVLVDDLGPEAAMRPMLRRLRDRHEAIRLLENEANVGFVESCNRGLALRGGDAVVLNSDAEVTPGWLAELLEVLHREPDIAAVCPLSNQAGSCTVPVTAQTYAAAGGRGAPGTASLPRATELVTGVGFCLLMRGEVLDTFGGFDPAYGRGYNEENDWCQRVRQAGFRVVRANRAFVFHQGQASFGDERGVRDRYNGRRLIARYPRYVEENRAFDRSLDASLAARAVRVMAEPPSVRLEFSAVAEPESSERNRAERALTQRLLQVPGIRGAGEAADIVHIVGVPTIERLRAVLGTPATLVVSLVDVVGALHGHSAQESWAALQARRAALWVAAQAGQVFVPTREAARRLAEFTGLMVDDIGLDGWAVSAADERDRAAARRRPATSEATVLAVGVDEATFEVWRASIPMTWLGGVPAADVEALVSASQAVVTPDGPAVIGYDEAMARAAGVPIYDFSTWRAGAGVPKAGAPVPAVVWPEMHRRLVHAPSEAQLLRRRRVCEVLAAITPG